MVVRSALGVKAFGLAEISDAAVIIVNGLNLILNRTSKILILADSETLFNVVIRNGTTTEKKLMIYIKASQEAYNEGIK